MYRFDKSTSAAEARAAATRLALDPDVEYAVPDQVMHAMQTTPNDTEYAAMQWTLQAPPAVVGGANLPLAWQRTTGSNTVVVAVLDTGIRAGHPDLAGRLLTGYDFISSDAFAALNYPANWNAADGDGRDADPTDPGDFLDDTLLAQLPPNHGLQARPSSWHGTHVAGTIGAASNNAVGISGVDWSARILPVRVLGRNGGSLSDVIDGIAWAAGLAVPGVPANANPARVINISLGASGVCSAAYQDVINRVRAAGAIVVAPAGNDGALVVSQPANCEGVIAVTAHARDGDNASYSNVGSQVALSAPGGGCGALALIDLAGAQETFNQSCAGCHSIDSLRQQIMQRAPAGLTFAKSRAALNSALMGVDLDGQDTGDMAALAVGLNNTARNNLAGAISQIACTGPTDRVFSTLNLGMTTSAMEGYGTKVGTSTAASHVSGTIALLLSLAPRLTADEAKSVLQVTARAHPKDTYCAMGGTGCGSGLLDANAAVQHVVTNRPTVTAALQPAAPGVRPGATFTLVGDVKAGGGRMPATSGHELAPDLRPGGDDPAGQRRFGHADGTDDIGHPDVRIRRHRLGRLCRHGRGGGDGERRADAAPGRRRQRDREPADFRLRPRQRSGVRHHHLRAGGRPAGIDGQREHRRVVLDAHVGRQLRRHGHADRRLRQRHSGQFHDHRRARSEREGRWWRRTSRVACAVAVRACVPARCSSPTSAAQLTAR